MSRPGFADFALMSLTACYFVQYGGQLFALLASARIVAKAPPRSFAMFEGPYGYDSSAFWDTVPTVTFVLFLISLFASWGTRRWNGLLLAFILFVVGALLAIFWLMPEFAALQAIGFSDVVDPALQERAARWLAADWAIWSLGLLGGIPLLLALTANNTTVPGRG